MTKKLFRRTLATVFTFVFFASAINIQAATNETVSTEATGTEYFYIVSDTVPTTEDMQNMIQDLIDEENSEDEESNVVDIAAYQARNFYGLSIPEPASLSVSCDTVSFYAVCANDATDTLCCHIFDLDDDGDGSLFTFPANGSTVTTYAANFPAGDYGVFCTGSTTVKKTYCLVVFTKVY